MKEIFKKGDCIVTRHKITEDDFVKFENEILHKVYSTYSLTRDAEWACRQFVLRMKENDEEGIGTKVEVNHVNPAFIGETVDFYAYFSHSQKNNVFCYFNARSGQKLIAYGKTAQKVLMKNKIAKLFTKT